MPTPAERLGLLVEVHGVSLRCAAEMCGLDHTTLMRVRDGETVNPDTLAKIAEGFGVPVSWMRGERDLATDFMFAVLSRPLQERVMFLWERGQRIAFSLRFLRQYTPEQFTAARLSDLLQMPQSEVEGMLVEERVPAAGCKIDRLCSETGLPVTWFETGLVGREDEDEILVGLTHHALTTLAQAVGADLPAEDLLEAAIALV